mgnify:CR=1 FL=1
MYDAHVRATRRWYVQKINAIVGEDCETAGGLRKWSLAEIVEAWRGCIVDVHTKCFRCCEFDEGGA